MVFSGNSVLWQQWLFLQFPAPRPSTHSIFDNSDRSPANLRVYPSLHWNGVRTSSFASKSVSAQEFGDVVVCKVDVEMVIGSGVVGVVLVAGVTTFSTH